MIFGTGKGNHPNALAALRDSSDRDDHQQDRPVDREHWRHPGPGTATVSHQRTPPQLTTWANM
jgi:hypothetical protein